jgi:hypothetical protein
MAVDHFLLPRLFRISRPLTQVPAWSQAGTCNVPAVVALLAAVIFGVIGLADLPSGWGYDTAPSNWGPVPVEAWVLSGVVYIAAVAVTRAVVPSLKGVLGFASYVPDEQIAGVEVVDIASTAA